MTDMTVMNDEQRKSFTRLLREDRSRRELLRPLRAKRAGVRAQVGVATALDEITEAFTAIAGKVAEIREGLIQRLFIYLDPDYGDADAASYPWLGSRS
jgi:hypothetical protein